ncbi:WecB/TagA/CpsF family glycosyltransferase [Vibrio cholerae]
MAGVDLFLELNAMAAQEQMPVFYLGAKQEIVEKTAAVMQAKHPQLVIAGYHHGYFWDDEQAIVEKIRQSGAKLLFVAITSPKKENFINRWQEQLGVLFVMGVGGTFDVVAGHVSRLLMDAKSRIGMAISCVTRTRKNVEALFNY